MTKFDFTAERRGTMNSSAVSPDGGKCGRGDFTRFIEFDELPVQIDCFVELAFLINEQPYLDGFYGVL